MDKKFIDHQIANKVYRANDRFPSHPPTQAGHDCRKLISAKLSSLIWNDNDIPNMHSME